MRQPNFINNYTLVNNIQHSNLNLILSFYKQITQLCYYFNVVLGKFLLGILFNLYDISLICEIHSFKNCIYILKNHLAFLYYLVDIVVIDRPLKKNRFELIYLFVSYKYSLRLAIHLYVNELAFVPSISDLYMSAMWVERECWDMFGILFSGHSDLRRLFTDYGFIGYPLRKDFPLTGYFEIFYSDLMQRIRKSRVILMQEYRYYDFIKIW